MQTEDGRIKLNAINMSLVSNVEERCQCGFSLSNIMSPNFRCFEQSEDAVTYRAEISGTPLALPNQIVSFVEEWLSEGALILFDIVLVPVDGSCQVVVSSIVDPECNTPIPATTSASPMEQLGSLGAIVGGAIGVIIVLVVAVIIVIIIVILVRAKRTGVFVVKNTRYRYVC